MLSFQNISCSNGSFEGYPHEKKKNDPRISLIRVLNHLLIIYIHLKLLFRMYLKQMFLLRCCSRKVLRVKFEKKASKII